jgi:Domain of unknown function (DUF4214)
MRGDAVQSGLHTAASALTDRVSGEMKMRTSIADGRVWLPVAAIAITLAAAWLAGTQEGASQPAPSASQLMGEPARDGERTVSPLYTQLADQQLDGAKGHRNIEGRDHDDKQRRRDQLIWFAPLYAYVADGAGVRPFVQLDYMNLFAADSPWSQARGRIHIFTIYSQLVNYGPDSAMRMIFTYLNQNHIALAMDFGPLMANAQCGQNVEGYSGGPGEAIRVAQKIKSLGGNLAYVAMDEPLYFGHYSQQPGACQWPIQTVAQQAAATARAFKTVFPDVQIGDIEPLNAFANSASANKWPADTKEWIEGFRAAAGFPLAFFHDDADWSVPLNRFIPQLQELLEREDIPFGMIFDGTDNAVSDAGWMAAAEEHIQAYNHSGNARPAQIIFQTWNAYPTRVLPETSPTALSYLVDFYFSPRARLSPVQSLSKNVVLLPAGAVVFRSTCDLNTLGAAPANPLNEVAYDYCLMLARAADPGGLQGYAAALANHSITLQGVLDAAFTSTEFQNRFSVSSMSNSDFVAFLYGLLLFRLPTRGESDRYVSALHRGVNTRQQVFDSIIHMPEFAEKNPILRGL